MKVLQVEAMMAESRTKARRPEVADPVKEREAWLRLLGELIGEVERWVRPEWSTRVIEKEMRDSVLGEYNAPALLMQREIARVLLEPITRFAPGTDGVVDLYLMPAYDDVATLFIPLQHRAWPDAQLSTNIGRNGYLALGCDL